MDTGKRVLHRTHAFCPALFKDQSGQLRECNIVTGKLDKRGGTFYVEYNEDAAFPRDGFRCRKHGNPDGGFDCSH